MRKGIILFFSTLFVFSYSFTPSLAVVVPAPKDLTVPRSKPSPAEIKSATKEFMALSKKEKKARFKEAKKAIKEYKKERKKGVDSSTNTLLLVLIALFIPPLAVYLHQGDTNKKFWITTILFALGIIGALAVSGWFLLAAIVYALIVILSNG